MSEGGGEPRRYCDLVMKGGITSGLVYPQAVIELARTYRFKSIGGTSAGAIAAAFSAAAALGERRKAAAGSPGGFGRLERTAKELSSPGRIFSLFQPVPALRRAYRLLVRLSAKPPKPVVMALVLLGSVAMAPIAFVAALLVLLGGSFLIAGWPGVAAAALPSLACSAALAVYRAASGTADRLRDNLLGMCPGTSQSPDRGPALSDWMHTEIRALAGVGEGDGPPVLFEDLWNAPAYGDETPPGAGERMLSLEVITTDVSHSEPRTLPFARGTLWFRDDQMRRLFPATVVDAMIAADGTTVADGAGRTYYRLPRAGKLPLVVAARMSLSFPLLICAVPLWEQHFLSRGVSPGLAPATDAAGKPATLVEATEALTSASDETASTAPFEMRVCWFTDGGVSSNFPLHLFDAPMPRWPTFAINLVYPPADAPPSASPVSLPSGNNQGWRPRYNGIERDGGFQAVGAFILGIVATMQNWRDLLQGRAPGYRDRIAQIEVAPEEGGMNLDMPPPVLEALAGKGRLAGEALKGFDFENHFWVRYRNLQAALERYGIDLTKAFRGAPAGAEEAYERARDGVPNVGPYPLNVGQAREAARRINELLQELDDWADWDGSLADGAPNPPPALRIVPTF